MSNFVNLLDIIYPIGSVYITFSATSPANAVGAHGNYWKMFSYIVLLVLLVLLAEKEHIH